MADLQQTSHAWKKIAADWNRYFTVPSRPSDEELETYTAWVEALVAGKSDVNALVMGATPELRDVLFTAGAHVHCIDINIEMLLAMSELLRNPNPDEVLIQSNWLTNPLASDYFDIVLGDAVLPNVPWNSRDQLFFEIFRWLKSDGYFLNRAFFVPENNPHRNVTEVLKSYAAKESNYKNATELVFEVSDQNETAQGGPIRSIEVARK